MTLKYNRVSTEKQTGNRFLNDTKKYDKIIFEKISGSVNFFERPGGKEILKLIKDDKIEKIIFDDVSRCGRNTKDIIDTLTYFENNKISVEILQLNLTSHINGKKNPMWGIVIGLLASICQFELDNIRERTEAGRQIYKLKGGLLGRPKGTKENDHKFLNKSKSINIIKYLNKSYTVREVAKITNTSTTTVMKVKRIYNNHK